MEKEQFLDRDGDAIEGTEVNDDGTVTLTLEKPVLVFGEKKPALVLAKPSVPALKRLDGIKGATAQAISLIAASANIPAPSVEALDFADFTAAARVCGGFTRKVTTTSAA